MLSVLLKSRGYEIDTASDGSYALEKIILNKPDLILLDIDMPEMNGLEVLERVKENPSTAGIPVIMLTANTDADSFERAVNKKADRYVAKPFKTSFLMDKIDEVLKKYGLIQRSCDIESNDN